METEFSVIIPTLNEASEIGPTLSALRSCEEPVEIIVVDGGSTDETVAIARDFRAKVIDDVPRGRGSQLHAGASIATGDVLLFLHADSIPPVDAFVEIRRAFETRESVAGNFALRFNGGGGAARFMTWFYPQIRRIGLIYGDSGIFVRRETYEQIGGFEPLPLFEDLELIGRLKKEGKWVHLQVELTTSSRRFEGRPFIPVFLRWVLFQCLYWIGVSPYRLAKGYHPLESEKPPANERNLDRLSAEVLRVAADRDELR